MSSLTRMVETAMVAAFYEAALRAVDRVDPVGAEARDALTDDQLATFVGPGVSP